MIHKEHLITTLVRTKQFWQYRLKGNDARSPIYLKYDDVKPFTDNPTKKLNELCSLGQLERVYQKGRNGNEYAMYRAKNKGVVNPSLLIKTHLPLDKTTSRMMDILKNVTLKQDAPSTPYFTTFLNCKSLIQLFFNVDVFSGRVHTPITNFKSEYRNNILLNGQETISIDVVTMQPLLLGSILKSKIGENEYSKWIDEGKDIYIMLQSKAKLTSRDEAKKRFFEILFSRPNEQLSKLFGNSIWIEWINEFKRQPFTPNPHTIEKNHSNLAWLLQRSEVYIMREVWSKLLEHGILFVSIHDEVIVQLEQYKEATKIFKSVMDKYFDYYRLSDKQEIFIKPSSPDEVRIPKPKKGELYSINELRTKFQLSDEHINQNFKEFYHNIGWIDLK